MKKFWFGKEMTAANCRIHERLCEEGEKYKFVGNYDDVEPPVKRGRRVLDIDVDYDDYEAEIRDGFYSTGRIQFTYAKEDLQINGGFTFHTDMYGWHIHNPDRMDKDDILFTAPNKEAALKKCIALIPAAWRHHKEKREFRDR